MSWREWFSKQKADTGRGGAQGPVLADRQASKPATGGAKPAGGTVLRASDAAPAPFGASSAPRAIPYFSIGDRIADTYEVKRIIEGGMGWVYVVYYERWRWIWW
jgi:hypothetical protein